MLGITEMISFIKEVKYFEMNNKNYKSLTLLFWRERDRVERFETVQEDEIFIFAWGSSCCVLQKTAGSWNKKKLGNGREKKHTDGGHWKKIYFYNRSC